MLFFKFIKKISKILTRKISYHNSKPLNGINFWLCGAIPEKEHWSHPLVDRDILEFTSIFSSLVLKNGGTITHGSHPNLTPILKRSASKFSTSNKQLQLFISEMFVDQKQRETGKYIEKIIPAERLTALEYDRNRSLRNLREKMVKDANVAIFIGGKLHLSSGFQAGIPEEMSIAQERGIPSYVLGGVDGAAKNLADVDYLSTMNTISDIEDLKNISTEKNLFLLPSKIIGDVIHKRNEIRSR